MTSITVVELKQRLQKTPAPKIIDVRSPEEFNGMAIPGAINIPTGQVLQRRAEFVSPEPVYIICQSGTRSRLVTLTLRAQGVVNLVNVAGGMNAWIQLV
ncbi:MAG: rhodanese-domain-containing protein [uncultured bacterium]|nr:MAG: rhodanese-domain-containing protein [uncultured bacterium]